MDGAGSESCSVAGLDVVSVGPAGYAIRELVSLSLEKCDKKNMWTKEDITGG